MPCICCRLSYSGALCGGVHLHVMDAAALRPTELGLRLLALVRDMYPNDFALLPPGRADGRPFISLLAGHRELERPGWDAATLIARARRECAAFAERRRPYLLYE